jgi:hypothetical protein
LHSRIWGDFRELNKASVRIRVSPLLRCGPDQGRGKLTDHTAGWLPSWLASKESQNHWTLFSSRGIKFLGVTSDVFMECWKGCSDINKKTNYRTRL